LSVTSPLALVRVPLAPVLTAVGHDVGTGSLVVVVVTVGLVVAGAVVVGCVVVVGVVVVVVVAAAVVVGTVVVVGTCGLDPLGTNSTSTQ
jgi:hypothetical protein